MYNRKNLLRISGEKMQQIEADSLPVISRVGSGKSR